MTVIDDILKREGPPSNHPADKGGRTAFGISERNFPDAWKDGKVTEEEARAIYDMKFVKGPGFDKVPDKRLREQLIDYGVNSGPMVAIQKLQDILKVPVDGILGPATLTALASVHPDDANSLLVVARVKMIGQIVSKNPSQVKFLNGWLNRALEFI